MINKYEELLEQLKNGDIQELKVENSAFFLFREAWLNRTDRIQIVGEAHHGGHVTYRYEHETEGLTED